MAGNPFDFADDSPGQPRPSSRRRIRWLPSALAGGAVLVVGATGCCAGVVAIVVYLVPSVVPQPRDPDPGNHEVSLEARWYNCGRPVPELKFDWRVNEGHPPRGPGKNWLILEHHGKKQEWDMGEYKPGLNGTGGMQLPQFAGASQDRQPARVWIEYRPADGGPPTTVSRVVSATDLGVFDPPKKR